MHARAGQLNYELVEMLAEARRWTDRAWHLPLIGFLAGGGVAALLWAAIGWLLWAAVR